MKEIDPELEHRKQIIKARWLAGATSSQIGKELRISRNSVMGYVNRMKLPQRSQDAVRQEGKKASHKHKPRGFALAMIPGLGFSVSKDKKDPYKPSKDILEPLGPIGDFPPGRTCRAISGDVALGNWQCCGRPGYPYCAAHKERLTVKPLPYRRPA